MITPQQHSDNWQPHYSKWRHGGWYVLNIRYPSGAIGCISRNYPDRKWRIVCDPRPFGKQPTFNTRDEAASAERALINTLLTSPSLRKEVHL